MKCPIWININKELPNSDRLVLVTNGEDIGVGYWFGTMYNQHCRLFGAYIENPTYWLNINDLIYLLGEWGVKDEMSKLL
jgi:hypothetical protein